MPKYAENTSVSVDRSLDELRRTVRRFGATHFAFMDEPGSASVAFQVDGRRVRFRLELPSPDDADFTRTPTGRVRSASAASDEWEKACRQRWRSLAMVVKAKLVAIDDGISTFEQEFLAHLVLPSGQTVFEQIGGELGHQLESGVPGRLALEAGS